MQVIDRVHVIGYEPQVYGENADKVILTLVQSSVDKKVYELNLGAEYLDKPIQIKWKFKAIGVKGAWTSNNILDKRFKTDWESPKLNSSISTDAPIISLFGHDDENIVTVACSELIDFLPIEGSLREEDNHFYFNLHFFKVAGKKGDYKTQICISTRVDQFSQVIQEMSEWMVAESKLLPRPVPPLAKVPIYSTWYSFHQDLNEEILVEECRLSKELGYDLVIIDDGWQTLDNNRGYDYTGDWRSERFSDFKALVKQINDLGMGVMLWYSVPFCGIKSDAYQKFQGKFLTENHHWAPVFDPRFPEVRQYLVDIYATALKELKLDGFKLDFLDDFKVYPETETQSLNGRDTLSVTQGVFKLVREIAEALTNIKQDVLIEFRQQYINPSLRILGNMFRAFDCPNDSLMNRVRITDVKLLCGESAVHSDMITWSKYASVEQAALQFTSLMFSVPQLSVRLAERSTEELDMSRFFTKYWNDNKQILLNGDFTAFKPLSNYPLLRAEDENKVIIGIYDDVVLEIDEVVSRIDIINGKLSKDVVLNCPQDMGTWKLDIIDCRGILQSSSSINLVSNVHRIVCPENGMIYMSKI